MICPVCNKENIKIQTMQENRGSVTRESSKSRYKEKGHSFVWWLIIGWWWWIIDLSIWVCRFLPRLIIQLFKKKKYVGKSISISETTNDIIYKTICTCQDCGNVWTIEVNPVDKSVE